MKKIKEYDTLRIILLILVVIGHSAYLGIATKYGGIYFQTEISNHDISLAFTYRLFRIFVAFIQTFHMELFMMLSGTLFMYSFKKYSRKELFIKKAKKLLIPYLIIMAISINIKNYVGYWDYSTDIAKDIIVGQLFLQGNCHLWFLPTLFFIFVLTYYMELSNMSNKLRYIILITLYFINWFIPINIVSLIFKYLLWFNIGIIFEKNRELINSKINIKYSIFELILSFGLFLLYRNNMLPVQMLILPIINILMINCIYTISYYLSKTNFNIKILLKDSFEIYLLSDLVNYIYIYILANYFSMNIFASNSLCIVIILVRIFLQFFISILVTETYKYIKTKAVKYS